MEFRRGIFKSYWLLMMTSRNNFCLETYGERIIKSPEISGTSNVPLCACKFAQAKQKRTSSFAKRQVNRNFPRVPSMQHSLESDLALLGSEHRRPWTLMWSHLERHTSRIAMDTTPAHEVYLLTDSKKTLWGSLSNKFVNTPKWVQRYLRTPTTVFPVHALSLSWEMFLIGLLPHFT